MPPAQFNVLFQNYLMFLYLFSYFLCSCAFMILLFHKENDYTQCSYIATFKPCYIQTSLCDHYFLISLKGLQDVICS